MFGKCADTRNEGASGTAKLVTHRLWAKRKRSAAKAAARHSGLEIVAKTAFRIEVPHQRLHQNVYGVARVALDTASCQFDPGVVLARGHAV
jgi:hypothetical protein